VSTPMRGRWVYRRPLPAAHQAAQVAARRAPGATCRRRERGGQVLPRLCVFPLRTSTHTDSVNARCSSLSAPKADTLAQAWLLRWQRVLAPPCAWRLRAGTALVYRGFGCPSLGICLICMDVTDRESATWLLVFYACWR